MIPVLTASAPQLSRAEQATLNTLERAAQLAPDGAAAAAELGAALPLWHLRAGQWTAAELAAHGGQVMRRIAPWVATGLLPRARRTGERPHEYSAAIDSDSLRLSAHRRASEFRRVGRMVRRFARVPRVQQLLASPDVAQLGAVASSTWPELSTLAQTLAAMEPRDMPTSNATAGAIDWQAEDAKARAERRKLESDTRAGFYKRVGALTSAYAAAAGAFPVLLVAAPAVAAALAWGAAMFEAWMAVGKVIGMKTGNEPEQVERAARELRWWSDLGVPPLRFDGAIWSARGYADTLAKVRSWYERAPADVQGAFRDLGVRIKNTAARSSVANAAVDAIALGPSGYGPVWWGLVWKKDPTARTIAERMGAALSALYATDYELRGMVVPEAKMKAAATNAYHATLLDPSISLDDTYGIALARAVQNVVATAEASKLPLLRAGAMPKPDAGGNGGGAAVAGLGLAALLLFL